jgi:DNA-directed RNA polymerase delta subunit
MTIESVREGAPLTGMRRAETASLSVPQEEPQGGVFLGMTIVDAAKKYLATKRCTQTNTQITNGLLSGGLILNSQEPMNTVGSVLTRRFHENGDIVRVSRGVWGLREWYPRQSFKTKADQVTEASEREEETFPPMKPETADMAPGCSAE